MPKIKRFKNLQKSDQIVPSSQHAVQPVPTIESSISPVDTTPEVTSRQAPSLSARIQRTPSFQTTRQEASSFSATGHRPFCFETQVSTQSSENPSPPNISAGQLPTPQGLFSASVAVSPVSTNLMLEDTLIELYLANYTTQAANSTSDIMVAPEINDTDHTHLSAAGNGIAYELEEGEWIPDDWTDSADPITDDMDEGYDNGSLFGVLREMFGTNLHGFIEDEVFPIFGDIACDSFD